MEQLQFRLLTAREIECRVAQIREKGLQLLLYKDARTDMSLLDETVGPMNWMRHHTRDNANCIISIWDAEKGCWVDKEDVGTESNTEAVKGLASDSFKRAGTNWGIGRELYTAPFIWIQPPNCKIETNRNGKLVCYDNFSVSEIGFNEHREINRLVIINTKTGNAAYEYGKPSRSVERASKAAESKPKEEPKQETKDADRPVSGAFEPATEFQKKLIIDKASDDHYMEIMTMYGSNLENLSVTDADKVLDEIADRNAAPSPVTCERCSAVITGVALPDGSTMTGGEIVGKSKLTYGGVYCWKCMKELKRAANKRKAG